MNKKILLLSLFLSTKAFSQSVLPPELSLLRKIVYFSQQPEKISTESISSAFDTDLVMIECYVIRDTIKQCSYAANQSSAQSIPLQNLHVSTDGKGALLGGSALWQVFDKAVCLSNQQVAELVGGRREAIFPPPMPYPPPAPGQEVEAAYFVYSGINPKYPSIRLSTYSENGCVVRLNLNAETFW